MKEFLDEFRTAFGFTPACVNNPFGLSQEFLDNGYSVQWQPGDYPDELSVESELAFIVDKLLGGKVEGHIWILNDYIFLNGNVPQRVQSSQLREFLSGPTFGAEFFFGDIVVYCPATSSLGMLVESGAYTCIQK